MDDVLFAAWQKDLPPFDGQTITVKNAVPLETLSQLLTKIVDELREAFGMEPLYFLDDWHEHDGVVLAAKPVSWDTLQSEVESAHALSQFVFGDYAVRRGFYTKSGRFYLRFYINEDGNWQNDVPDGDFDLTVSGATASALSPALRKRFGDKIRVFPANAFFAERYNGHIG